ncbi:MAG: 2-amino-4-hydroxy-6-hydroxymethyldihydropteridine diphosphokinase [Novosphingobium sp.]|nr:2-amino-4-hydroxy-6-hydroxymethyldihydropteridine diphosphokinase [Novosphingobium sp.]
MGHRYLIALGSNRRHYRHGRPEAVLRAAFGALGRQPLELQAASPIFATAPLGPSRRRYANAAALVETALAPDSLLDHLKAIERAFGRRPGGRRWAARVLDLDIVLWSGGTWSSPRLTIPHTAFRQRLFVLRPAAALTPSWRDPLTGLTLRQHRARLTRPHPLPIAPPGRALSSVGRATDF